MKTAAPTQAPATLTQRARLLRALRGEPVDRVPAWMMRQAGRYLPQYREARAKYDFLELCKTPEAAAEVSIQPLEAVGAEAVIIFNDIMLPLEAAGARVAFGDGGPRIDNPLRSADDLKSLRGRAVEPDEPVAGTIRRVRERVGDDVPILGFIGAPWTLAAYWVESAATRNFERLMKMRWDDPALLEAFLDRIADVAAAYLRIQIEAGADAVQIFDSWGATLGQSDYMRFSGRFIRRIIESVADLGAPVIVYLNGVAPYLDSLAMLGADCISIDARIDLATARRALPAGIALQGNLDPTALFARPDAVERAVKDLFARFPPASGHVLNLGHGVLPATPVESVRRFFEAARRYGAHQ